MSILDSGPISRLKLPAKAFDVMRALCEVVIPGLATIYVGLAPYIDIPYLDEVPEWAAALTLIIGIIVNTARHNHTRDRLAKASQEASNLVVLDGGHFYKPGEGREQDND